MNIPEVVKNYRLIPLLRESKRPVTEWKGVTFDMEDYPDITSYAINTGESGLVVIDCDMNNNNNGTDGVRAFLNLIGENDENGFIDTLTVATPNGGLHFYFKNPTGATIKNSVSKLLPSVDVRAEGGYIVGPGSKVKNDKGEVVEYTIEDGSTEIADLPDWLRDKLFNLTAKDTEPKPQKEVNKKDTIKEVASKSSEAEKRLALYWAKEKMNASKEGSRQSTLNSISYFMGRKRVSESDARSLINIAVNQGLEKKEAEQTFQHGYNDGLKEPEQDYSEIARDYNRIMSDDIKKDPADSVFYKPVPLSHHFADENPGRFLYWHDTKRWYEYNATKGCWETVPESYMQELMEKFLDNLVTTIRREHTHLPSNIYKIQEGLYAKSTVEAATTMLRNRYGYQSSTSLFDQDEFLLNCKNGVVNLKNGELLPHKSAYFMSHFIDVEYKPDATDSYCDKIIESVNPTEREYLQLMVGQSLVGSQNNYQAAIFFHGTGSNGKSTFIDLMLKTGGTYSKLQPSNIFLNEKSGGAKYALADFEGLRTAIVEELPNAKILDAGALKTVVGTNRINARAIYDKNREIENRATIFISCNRLPMITETDDGTWRRLLVITFPYSYKKSRDDVRTKWDRVGDPRVLYAANKSKTTAEAFLKWRVDGAIRWAKDDKAEYNVPQTILDNIQEWNENSDLVLGWARDQLVWDDTAEDYYITFDDLFRSFNDFLKSKGNAPVSSRFFSNEFLSHKFVLGNPMIVYKKSSNVLKGLERSPYLTFENPEGVEHKKVTNYLMNLRFK